MLLKPISPPPDPSGKRTFTQAYKCLFGDAIPDSVSFVESFMQVPLSAVLIFLFLLAVKNRFKIK